jgi:riboflavin synthase, alpha subunit
MFTGLVLGMGETVRISPGSGESRFRFRPLFACPSWVRGESIAVNGACLTVETFDNESFTAYSSQETLSLTTLGDLRPGGRVNLERALAMGDRLGGHLVSGHVDGVAVVQSVSDASSSRCFVIRVPEEFSPQIISKGSIALDGISLTVNRCGPDFLEVNVIPETRAVTTVGFWKAGTRLNFETDLIGKYVERMLSAWKDSSPGKKLSMDFLREHGF